MPHGLLGRKLEIRSARLCRGKGLSPTLLIPSPRALRLRILTQSRGGSEGADRELAGLLPLVCDLWLEVYTDIAVPPAFTLRVSAPCSALNPCL